MVSTGYILGHIAMLALQQVWSVLGTTVWGFCSVPIAGAFVGWFRHKSEPSRKRLSSAVVEALAAAVIVFALVFTIQFVVAFKMYWNHKMATVPPSVGLPNNPCVLHPDLCVAPRPRISLPEVSPELPTLGFQDDSDMVEATFGTLTGGSHIAMLKQMNGRSVYPIFYEGVTPVQFKYVNGKVSYSVKFWSPDQHSAIEVTDGKFTVRNDSLDRNYSSRALEIVNRDGYPILQIIWLTPGHMRLNGIFPLPSGQLLCMSDDSPKTIEPANAFIECAIAPIFKYPSWKYQGALATQ